MHVDAKLLRLTAPGRPRLVLAVALGVGAGLATVAAAYELSGIVARVFLDGATLAAVMPLVVRLAAAIVLRAALTWAGEATAALFAIGVKTGLRNRLAAHLVRLGPVAATGERTGELSTILVDGIEALDTYLRRYLPQLALAALIPLMVAALVLARDLLSGIVLLATAPAIPILMILIGKAAESKSRRQWQALARMGAHFLDVLQGLTALKILGRSREQAKVIQRITDRFRQATMGVLRVAFLSALALEMMATISTAVVAVEVGLRLLYGHLAFREAFFVLLLAPEFYLPLRLLGSRFHAGLAGVNAAARILDILETPVPVRTRGDRSAEVGAKPVIRFEDVAFAYPGRGRPADTPAPFAVQGIGFELEPGCTVAVVGPTGAGKSTIAHLLLRFADPTAGRITADGVTFEELSPERWRERIAWVPQRPYLFAGTVADNVRLARPGASDAEVEAAVRAAQAGQLIHELPSGLQTQIGERGVRLSGGQAQRLALARAFLKDAPILVLDEATSHLDPELEARLREATERLVEGRSALVIAHRLATVRRADTILVLEQGRIADRGSHDQLAARSGPYRRLLAASGVAG